MYYVLHPETNMEPEKGPLEKDENLQTTNF